LKEEATILPFPWDRTAVVRGQRDCTGRHDRIGQSLDHQALETVVSQINPRDAVCETLGRSIRPQIWWLNNVTISVNNVRR
jgi:hypothetical protein